MMLAALSELWLYTQHIVRACQQDPGLAFGMMQQGCRPKMSDTDPGQLLPAHQIIERGVSRRPRLLVVQPLVGIGDMVWHKPWIDHLAREYDIILATKPTVHAQHLFACTPHIADILLIERSLRGKRGRHDGISGLLRLATDIRSVKADKALILHHSARYGFASWLAGIAQRWGYGIGGSARWLNAGRFLDRAARTQHPTAKMAEFATLNGFSPPQTNWTIAATASACDAADTFIVEAGVGKTEHMLILGVGAMHVDRQWPPTHFARLIEKISARFPHLHFGLMGANAELPLIEAVIAQLSDASRVIICTRPLDQSIALLERALLYVGNDTSLLNIAAACGRPAIGLFAQTLPLIYNPKIKSVAVSSDQVGKPGAIKTIAPDLVFDAVCTELHHHGVVPAQVAAR